MMSASFLYIPVRGCSRNDSARWLAAESASGGASRLTDWLDNARYGYQQNIPTLHHIPRAPPERSPVYLESLCTIAGVGAFRRANSSTFGSARAIASSTQAK